MVWTLTSWCEVQSRLEHALQVLPDADSRNMFLEQSVLAAAKSESGFNALEALAWSLRYLQSLESDNIKSSKATAFTIATNCLRIGGVTEFEHPLSALHADLFDIKCQHAEFEGRSFEAFWRAAQAYQIRKYAQPGKEGKTPQLSIESWPLEIKRIQCIPPANSKTNEIESILWNLSLGVARVAEHSTDQALTLFPNETIAWRQSLSIFTRQLQRLRTSPENMGAPVENMWAFLANVSKTTPANIELLVWSAAAKVFAEKELFVFADAFQQQYDQLSGLLTRQKNPGA